MEKIKSILISRILYSQIRGRHCAPLRTTIPTEPNCSEKICFLARGRKFRSNIYIILCGVAKVKCQSLAFLFWLAFNMEAFAKKNPLIKNVLIYILTPANRSKYCVSFADYRANKIAASLSFSLYIYVLRRG